MRKPGDRRDVLHALTIIAIGLALGGCGGTGQMRKAQDAFSEAARIENQQRMAPETLIIADPAAVGPAADLVDGQLDKNPLLLLNRNRRSCGGSEKTAVPMSPHILEVSFWPVG